MLLGMMEDMVVGVADMAHVSFRITLASDPENIMPVIIGNRWGLWAIDAYFSQWVIRGSENSESIVRHSVLHCWNIAGPNKNQPDQK